MLLHYLKFSFRQITSSPVFAFVNLIGLALGYIVLIVLWPYCQSELDGDIFIKDHERIARSMVIWQWTDDGGRTFGERLFPQSPGSLSVGMTSHPEVEEVTRFAPQPWFTNANTPALKEDLVVELGKDDERLLQLEKTAAICADENFIRFFSFPLLVGDPATALTKANSVAISEQLAIRIFNTTDILAKTIKINGKLFRVSGVFKNLPVGSHFQFQLIFSNVGQLPHWQSSRERFSYHYFKMKTSALRLAEILNEKKDGSAGRFLQENPHITISYASQPLLEIKFAQSVNTFEKTTSRAMLRMLSAVSFIVVVMAWLNYINLNIARTRNNLKEIAIRKVSGALVGNLFTQFVYQSVLINLSALSVALIVIYVTRVPLIHLLDIQVLPIAEWTISSTIFIVLVIMAGIVATAYYPTWIVRRYTARELLRNEVPTGRRSMTDFLTTVQYCAAITLITWVFIAKSQMDFIFQRELGIDIDGIVVIEAPTTGLEHNGNLKMLQFAEYLRGETKAVAALSANALGETPQMVEVRNVGSAVYLNIDSDGGVDEYFIPLHNIHLVAGRNFRKGEKDLVTILSRHAIERLGFPSPQVAVGKRIEIRSRSGREIIEIIGVTEDYRVTPLYNIEFNSELASGRGQCLTYLNNIDSLFVPARVSVRFGEPGLKNNMSKVRGTFDNSFPGNVFHWSTLDSKIRGQYSDHEITRTQISSFTVIVIAVACIGILGTMCNSIVRKTKEITIRKIFGADFHHIAAMLLKTTTFQVMIAAAIGWPIAWKFSMEYLQRFSEQISLAWWHFAIPLCILLLIMTSTIVTVMLRAIFLKPVDFLNMNNRGE